MIRPLISLQTFVNFGYIYQNYVSITQPFKQPFGDIEITVQVSVSTFGCEIKQAIHFYNFENYIYQNYVSITQPFKQPLGDTEITVQVSVSTFGCEIKQAIHFYNFENYYSQCTNRNLFCFRCFFLHHLIAKELWKVIVHILLPRVCCVSLVLMKWMMCTYFIFPYPSLTVEAVMESNIYIMYNTNGCSHCVWVLFWHASHDKDDTANSSATLYSLPEDITAQQLPSQ